MRQSRVHWVGTDGSIHPCPVGVGCESRLLPSVNHRLNKNNNLRPRRNRGQNRAATLDRATHPPPFAAAFVLKKTLRFKANAAFTASSVNATNLLDLLCMADTVTTAQRLCSSVRLDYVELWAPMASDLAPVTVSVEIQTPNSATIGGPNLLKSDTSMGADRCAHVMLTPPPQSQSSMWQSRAGASTLFTMSGPINTVIDVHLSFYLQNGETPLAVASAVAGATVGTVYCRGLDALAAAATVFPPVSYATI